MLLLYAIVLDMAHIAIDARIISTSTGTYVERLLTYLEKIDSKNTYSVLVPTKDADYWQPTNSNFTVRTVDYANYSFGEQIGFKKYLDELGADLVHFCMPQQPIRYKGKSVTTVHDLTLLKTYNSDKNWLLYRAKQLVGRYVFKRIAKINDYIIVPSQYTADEYVAFSGIDRKKVILTYESADALTTDKLEPYAHDFKQFIMYVGQQSDYKNIKRLGEAHQQLLEKYPDLGLILVGKLNASARKNQQYFASQGFKNIVFTDFIPDSQRDWLYKNATAYIFPSLMEGFGLPGLEAMGYGTPVVSSDATCLPEVYGNAAHYFDPLSVDDMARAIGEVLTDSALRANLVKNGYSQLGKYSWERMAVETLAIYERSLS